MKTRVKLKELGNLFMKNLRKKKLLELVIPRISQLDLVGCIEIDDDYDLDATVVKKTILSSETSKCYAQLMAIAGLVAELNYFGKTTSQRDIYYSLKNLFKTQIECNKCILDLGLMLGLKRHEMGIVPTSKGHLRYKLARRRERERDVDGNISTGISDDDDDAGDEESEREGEGEGGDVWYDCLATAAQGGIAVSGALTRSNITIEISPGTQLLLVVEKEGIFHRLCEENFCNRVRCIMITGCGFPDIATRALVSHISDLHPELTVLGLCDMNPYGAALLLCYRFPSAATAFEGEGLQAHNLRWLGLRSHHLEALLEDEHCPLDRTNLQPFTANDKNKVKAMMRTGPLLTMPDYMDELSAMLEGDVKCELEALYSLGPGYLGDFLEKAILTGDYI